MDFQSTVEDFVHTWLVSDTKGPTHEISPLQSSIPPSPRRTQHFSLPGAECYFIVSFNAVQDWSLDPKVLSGRYPADAERYHHSLHDANDTASDILSKNLQSEIEDEHDELYLDELDEMFPVGEDNHRAVKYDRAED